MDSTRRRLRWKQLERQLSPLRQVASIPPTPKGGWIKSIREAYGMSLETLGGRLKTSRQGAHQLEVSERRESIPLKRLRLVAEALECELVVLLIPREPIDQIIQSRALTAAKGKLGRTAHTMALESQSVEERHLTEMAVELAQRMIDRNDQMIWELN